MLWWKVVRNVYPGYLFPLVPFQHLLAIAVFFRFPVVCNSKTWPCTSAPLNPLFQKKTSTQVSPTNPTFTTPAHIKTTQTTGVTRNCLPEPVANKPPPPSPVHILRKFTLNANSQLCYRPFYAEHAPPTHNNLIMFHVQQHLLKHILFHAIGFFNDICNWPFPKTCG